MINALTVDVEEYFHPSEVQRHVCQADWSSLPSRVEHQVDRILNLFDDHRVAATFFVLGWVAERQPALMRRIVERGHDIGCHSYAHQLVYGMTPAQFREDTRRAVTAIEDACGVTPTAYRAPSYSITSNAFGRSRCSSKIGSSMTRAFIPLSTIDMGSRVSAACNNN